MLAIDAYLEVINRLPEAVILLSGDGTVLGANRRVLRLGIDPDAIQGRNLADLAAQPPAVVTAYCRRCARSADLVPGSVMLRSPDGAEVPYRADGCLLSPASGTSPAVIMLRLQPKDRSVGQFLTLNQKIDELGREITRRKQVEERLREQKEWLAVTLASIGDAVIATDTGGRIIFMNRVAQALTGWPEAEATGRPSAEVFRVVEEPTRTDVESPVERCLREGAAISLPGQSILLARDGTEHAIDDTAAPIREAGGEVRGVVLIFREVGLRRRLERELHARAERLAENDRRKDEFLAMLAHELRNPVASISNAVHLFATSDVPADREWARGVMERQVKHLGRLIDDLLDVSRITRGKIALRQQVLNLAPIVHHAIEVMRPLIEERRHELAVLLAPNLYVRADPIRLEQVLANLLSNAARYTDAGGRISLAATAEGDDILIRVTDTGVGITPELLPRIFDLFAQGDRSIARTEGGLGIGLTLVRKLTEMHGGSVSAFSAGPGRGSEFTVRLPAAESGPEDPSAGNRFPRSAGAAARILIVDDNVDTAHGLERFLTLLGHDVRVALDGRTALDAARQHRPEVVLLDIGLPGMNGYEVAAALRDDECCKDALIIAVSGYGQDEHRRRSRAAGVDHHLVKPLDFDSLMSLLATGARSTS